MPKRIRMVVVLAIAGSLIAACNDDGAPRPRATATTTSLPSALVTLREFSISATPSSATAGRTTFQADNKGPRLGHQLVVAKTALAPDSLPTKANGTVDESKLEIVGRIAAFAPQMSTSTIFTLSPGNHVLFCNLVATTGSKRGAHYKLGMRTPLTVASN